MINMMRADLYRIFKGVGIYIAIILIVLMSGISIKMKDAGQLGRSDSAFDEAISYEITGDGSDESSLLVRSIISTNMNLYYPLIIIVFVLLVADFSNKTIKNTLTSATSKKKYFMYKMLMCLFGTIIFVTISNLYTYAVNFIVNGKAYTEPIGNIFKATFLQMPLLLGIVSFLVLLGFLFKKPAIFNAVSICFVMVFQLLAQAVYAITKADVIVKFMSKYELQTALKKLAYFPDSKYAVTCMCIGFAEILLCTMLGCFLFKKSEV